MINILKLILVILSVILPFGSAAIAQNTGAENSNPENLGTKNLVQINTHENIATDLIPKAGTCLNFKRIEISGDVIFNASRIKAIILPFAYQCLGNDLIKSIMGNLNKSYADKGYITTQAYIPDQDFASKVFKIQIVAGKIETIKIGDDQPLVERQIATAFPIKKGDILNMEVLQQGIDNIKKRPSKQASIKLKPGDKAGTSKVVISAKEEKFWRVSAGTHYTRYRGISTKSYDVTLELDNILGLNDGWKVALSGGENSNSLNTSFTAPIGWAEFTFSSDYSDFLSILTPTTELFAQNWNLTADMNYTAFRSPDNKIIVDFSISKKMSDRYINNTHLTPQRFTVAELGVKHIKTSGAFSITTRMGIVKGLTLLKAQIDPAVRDITTPRAQFLKLVADTKLSYVIKDVATLSSKWDFQWAPHALYSGQQMSLGGSGSVRGAGSAGMNVDIGITSQHQIGFKLSNKSSPTSSKFLAKFEPYLFVDAGAGKNIANAKKYYAASIGGGLKFDDQYFSFESSIAKPVFLKGVSNASKAAEFKINATIKF